MLILCYSINNGNYNGIGTQKCITDLQIDCCRWPEYNILQSNINTYFYLYLNELYQRSMSYNYESSPESCIGGDQGHNINDNW